MRISVWFLITVMFVAMAAVAVAGPFEIPAGTKCSECGMKVDTASKFAAQIVTADGENLAFCDIGDMLYHYREKVKNEPKEIYVQDFETGKWVDAHTASYLKDKQYTSPMGWGIAAFDDEASGGVKFSEAVELAR